VSRSVPSLDLPKSEINMYVYSTVVFFDYCCWLSSLPKIYFSRNFFGLKNVFFYCARLMMTPESIVSCSTLFYGSLYVLLIFLFEINLNDEIEKLKKL